MEIPFTPTDIDMMRRCAQRELKFRNWVYPKRIEKKTMTQQEAAFETEGMSKIYDLLCWIQIHTAPEQQKLF